MGEKKSVKNLLNLEQLNQIRELFVKQVEKFYFILALIATPTSLARSSTTGWSLLYTIQIFVALTLIVTFLWRNKIPILVRSLTLITVSSVLALGALFTLGFSGGGFLWILIVNLLAVTIYPPRVSHFTAAISLADLVVVAIGFITGLIQISFDANDYQVQISSWASMLAGVTVMLFLINHALGVLQASISTLFQEVQQQHLQIEHMANHDELTGLPSMRLARDRIEMGFRHADRHHKKMALLFLDLDGLKRVNDTFGHQAGDHILMATARRLRQTIRAEDTAARIGGDEFVIILNELTDGAAAAPVAEKIIKALSEPLPFGEQVLSVGASLGIAIYPDQTNDMETLRRMADEAMYRVKQSGKNNYRFAVSNG